MKLCARTRIHTPETTFFLSPSLCFLPLLLAACNLFGKLNATTYLLDFVHTYHVLHSLSITVYWSTQLIVQLHSIVIYMRSMLGVLIRFVCFYFVNFRFLTLFRIECIPFLFLPRKEIVQNEHLCCVSHFFLALKPKYDGLRV